MDDELKPPRDKYAFVTERHKPADVATRIIDHERFIEALFYQQRRQQKKWKPVTGRHILVSE